MLLQIDKPLMMRYDIMDYNHQGSVTELTNATGSNVKTYKYDAFGNIMQETGPTINRGFTYTSRQLHARSGLYYYRARWYSPELGRFLTQDPIGLLGGVNLYSYVENSPVALIDPLGLCQDENTDLNPFNIWLLSPFIFDWMYGLPPIAPPGVSIADNIASAQSSWNPFWFRNQVRGGGPWDYKQQHPVYERFGNFNYGATGKAWGFPDQVLLRAAGSVQENSLEE